jgi:hypothetical protein
MRIDALDIALRQRTPWEAVDLGIALVRRHAGTIARSWWLFGLPLFLLLNALAYAIDEVWLAGLLVWWLKPWFDQLVLHILSRAVFAAPPTARATLRQQFRIGAVLPWLLWRRIDLSRSLSMPVALLEGLRGRERSARSGVLARASTSSVAMGLCVVLLHVEAAITLSVFGLVLMFVPYDFLSESAQVMYELLIESPPRWAQVLVNFVSFLAMSVVEPFFVGAGFALYLNRRTQLEAWDIELAFRRIAQRLAALVLVGALLPLLLAVAPVQAATPALVAAAAIESNADPDVEAPDADDADALDLDAAIEQSEDAAVILDPAAEDADEEATDTNEVVSERRLDAVFGGQQPDPDFARDIAKTLEADVFGERRKLMRWEPIDKEREDEDARLPAWLRPLGVLFGYLIEFGLWILLAILIVVAVLYASRWRLPLLERLRRDGTPAAARVEADREPEALPHDLVAVARALFARGAVREAMALLYRGVCAGAPAQLGVALPNGATEADLLRLAPQIGDSDVRATLVAIVRAWQRAAYAHQWPDANDFDALTSRYSAAGWGAP